MNISEIKKDFIKILIRLDRSKGRDENFRNFCELSYCALAKKTAPNEAEAEKLEARYMSIVGRYKNKDDIREMPKLLSLIILGLNNGGCDFLGEIAGEIEVLDKKNGQFFTPYDISKMLAKISLPDIDALIKEDEFFTVSDPAAGAGCMILACADIVEEKGYNFSDCMSVHVTELSKMTYYMLFIQLSLRGISAQVINGNSLSLEVFESAYTPTSIYFLGKHGCMFKEHKAEKQNSNIENIDMEVAPIINARQIDLFAE